MINVWAYRTNNLGAKFKPANEWNEVIQFDSLTDLTDKLGAFKIGRGQLGKLGIVAHGDEPGRVELSPKDLTESSAAEYAPAFRVLDEYLWENARFIFFSCIAAQGPKGSALLNALSGKYLPGRHVIGFEKFGLVNSGEGQAGDIWCSEKFIGGKFSPEYYCKPSANITTVRDIKVRADQILTEYAIFSKWSYKGRIIKLPYNEVIQDVRKDVETEMFWGVARVSKALKENPDKIQYISVNRKQPSSKLIDLYGKVLEAGFHFTPTYDTPRSLHEWSEKETTLARKHHMHIQPPDMILAVNKRETVLKYKCAWPGCPTHKNYVDRCAQGLDHIPNGPNV